MGSACSSNVVENKPSTKNKQKKSTGSSTNLRYVKRDDADEILVKAPVGYYIFSNDAAGEEFLSVSAGAYVCHHPILKQGVLYVVGGEFFISTSQFLDFFKSNTLGSVKLTKPYTEHLTPTKKMSTSTSNNHKNNYQRITNDHFSSSSNTSSSASSQTKTSSLADTTPGSIIKRKQQQKHISSYAENKHQSNKENANNNINNNKKSRKVSFRDYPPPDVDTSRENINFCTTTATNATIHTATNVAYSNIRGSSVPEHPSCLSISEVSSAGDKEHYLADEPIPVLPAPSGVRPPPLFQRFSMLAAEFAEPYDGNKTLPDLKQLLFQLYKGNPKLKYAPRVNAVRLIATGEVDMYEERSYFLLQKCKELKHWAQDNDFTIEYTDVMIDRPKKDVEDPYSRVRAKLAEEVDREIQHCINDQLPFILLVYKGHSDGQLSIPESFSEDQFATLLRHLSEDETSLVKQYYTEDKNTIPCSYHLNDDLLNKDNENTQEDKTFCLKTLMEVYEKLFQNDNLERDLYEQFLPAHVRHIRSVLQSPNPFVLFIERTFYDGEQYQNNILPPNKNRPIPLVLDVSSGRDGNSRRLKERSRELYENLLLNNNLDEDEQFVTMETSFTCYLDNNDDTNLLERHCQNFSTLIADRLRSCISSIQQRLKVKTVSDLDYDEVLFHVLRSTQITFHSTVDEDSYQLLKKYIQGDETTTLVVSGEKFSGKSSLLSRAQNIAFDWFNGLCCIVYRQIGQTIESTSSTLLLQSICLQLSYAYGTDPNAIPNDIELIWAHYLKLMELATDSLPLVIILDGLAKVRDLSGHNLLQLLSHALPWYVKVIVSIDEDRFQDIQSDKSKIYHHHLAPFDDERAFQYLDHMLVAKDRTLNFLQKDLVSGAIATNNNPVFIRMLMSEIEKWKSASNDTTIPFKTLEGGFQRLCETSASLAITDRHLDALFYSVVLDEIGIPKNVLRTFLERINTDQGQFEIQSLLRRMLSHFECIIQHKLLSGAEVYAIRDLSIIELVQQRCQEGSLHTKYFPIFKEILSDCYGHLSVMDETSIEKQRLILNELAFFYRVLLKYGSKTDIKELFMFNFDYLFGKLACFSFAHLYDEVTTVTSTYPDDYEIAILSEIIHSSREGLRLDSSQFSLQIIGRLDPSKLSEHPNLLLKRLHNRALSLCSVLKPNRACLLSPSTISSLSREEQNQWTCKELKFMFLNHSLYEFVGWKSETQEIFYFDKGCCVQRKEVFDGLNKIVLTMENHLLIETKLGIHVLYNMTTLQSIFSVHNDYDIVGTDQAQRLILLRTDMRKIKIVDISMHCTTWTFDSDEPYNNVFSSSNGCTVLCFSDNRRKTPTRTKRSWDSSVAKSNPSASEIANFNEEDEEETYEELTVLNLNRLEKVTTINLPTEASFSKFHLMSEDGAFYVRITEPDMNILVWDLTTGHVQSTIKTNCCRIVRIAVSSVGNVVVTASSDASVRVFNLNDGSLRYTLTECIKSVRMDGQHCLMLSPDGKICVYFVRSNFQPSFVSVWNLCNGGQLASLTTDFYGLTYQISNDSSFLVSNFPSGLVRFDLSS